MEHQTWGGKRNVNKKIAECNSFTELTQLHISTPYLQLLVDFNRVPTKFQFLELRELKVQHSQGRDAIPVQSQHCKVPKKNIKRRIGKRRTLRDDAPALGLWRNRRPEAR